MFEIEKDPYISSRHEKLRRLGITALFFDLDDTLVNTHPLFVSNMRNFSDVIAQALGIDPHHIFDRLNTLNLEEHKKNGADPQNWPIIIQRLGEELGNVGLLHENYPLIQKIYTDAPEIIQGVRPILSGLSADHFLLGEVTWGEKDWSLKKNDQASITHYFDTITYADIHIPKSSADWLRGMNSVSVTPQKCIIVGDSLPGDIIPALKLGARAIYIPSARSIFLEGEIPPGVVQIDKFSDFYEAIDQLR
jgi:FMN phosphatase YigB (HAD superfamily)